MTTAADSAFDIPNKNEFKKVMRNTMSELKRFKDLASKEGGLLIPAQAAAMIGISPQAMERKMKDGSIRHFVVAGKVWVSANQIEEMMTERVKKLLDAGEDKNKIEESMYKKMYLNAKAVNSKRKNG